MATAVVGLPRRKVIVPKQLGALIVAFDDAGGHFDNLADLDKLFLHYGYQPWWTGGFYKGDRAILKRCQHGCVYLTDTGRRRAAFERSRR